MQTERKDPGGKAGGQVFLGLMLGLAALALVALLGAAVFMSEPEIGGLAGDVMANIETTGLANPVTAVLLDFRGYDTFLELVVMFVAVLGVWSLGRPLPPIVPAPTPVLGLAVRLIAPISVVFAGYLLWIGATEAGGAFQAGAVLAGAGVLAFCAGMMPDFEIRQPLLHRVLLALGMTAFLAIGVMVMAAEPGQAARTFLDYPDALGKWLILAIETAAMIAIALTLLALFQGARPQRRTF